MIQQVKHLQQVFANDSPDEFVNRVTVHESCYYQIEEDPKDRKIRAKFFEAMGDW